MIRPRLSREDYREILLKSFFALAFLCFILGMSITKILVVFRIKDVDPLVSVQITPRPNITVWSSFICGQNFTSLTVQTLKRGSPDSVKTLSQDLIQKVTTDNLTTGDWTLQTGSWPCFVFNPGNNLSFIPGEVDQVILLAFVDQVATSTPNGLLFGVFDSARKMSNVEPFVGPTPSINTFTFTREERLDVNNTLHSYFFVNKQNIIQTTFGNNLAARFSYSPDSYSVLRFTEKPAYTPYDLISSIGGLATYIFTAWFILFGRGKYRSRGLVQRYVLHNLPSAKKKDDDTLLPISYEKNNNSTLVDIQASSDIKSGERPSSIYYFTNSGTPTQSRFNISLTTLPYDVKELEKKIDAKINQKLWFVEQTLSRNYLAGFKLRRYDADLKKLGLDTSYDEEDEVLTPPAAHRSWNDSGSGVRNSDQKNSNNSRSIQIPLSSTPSSGSQYPGKINNNSTDSLNPEEQRPQYPNVAVDQVPPEKKQRGRNSGVGSGSYQQLVNATNMPTNVTTLPSSYYPRLSQTNVANNPIILTSSQLQRPLSGVLGNQGQVQVQSPSQGQGPSQGPPEGT